MTGSASQLPVLMDTRVSGIYVPRYLGGPLLLQDGGLGKASGLLASLKGVSRVNVSGVKY